jgi:surface polysaccharide O-acyltransferase-like enzyme
MFMQKDRDLSFDAFRGLAIVAVVATHGIYLGGSPNNPGFVCYRQLLNFAVPVLFFMSGYWSSKEQISSLSDYKTFLRRRLPRILVPYLFWSLVLIGYSAVVTGQVSGYVTIIKLLTGGASMGYYFIVVLAQLYILTPVLMHLNRKLGWYGLMLVLIFNMASFLALYLSRVFNYIAHIPAVLPFYTWIIYYEAGLFMAGRYEEAHTTSKTRFYILPALLFSLLVSILEAGVMSSKYNNPDMASFAGKYSSFLYSACVILCFIFGREYFGRMPKLLSTIGYYSLGIYLVHMIVLSGVVEVFRNITAISSFQPLYQLILVVITLSICLALIVAAGKLLPEFFCNGILGFGSRSGRLPVCIHRPSERGKQGKVGVGCGVEEA